MTMATLRPAASSYQRDIHRRIVPHVDRAIVSKIANKPEVVMSNYARQSPFEPMSIRVLLFQAGISNTLSNALLEARNLPDGWNGYGASRVSDHSLRLALNACSKLSELHGARFIEPSITPTCDGFISLDWLQNGRGLEIELRTDVAIVEPFVEVRNIVLPQLAKRWEHANVNILNRWYRWVAGIEM